MAVTRSNSARESVVTVERLHPDRLRHGQFGAGIEDFQLGPGTRIQSRTRQAQSFLSLPHTFFRGVNEGRALLQI